MKAVHPVILYNTSVFVFNDGRHSFVATTNSARISAALQHFETRVRLAKNA